MTSKAVCLFALLLGAVSAPAVLRAQVQTEVPLAVPGAKPVSVERIKIHASSVEGNLEGNAVERDVLVFLPPSYATERRRRYPVVYALHGYSIGAEQWSREIHAPQTIEGAFARGAKEMIVVLPDSKTVHNGSMYSASVTTGDFESFIARDVVSYVDAHYRTIAERQSRGLAGHSMGGYGATRIGMKHADVFGSLYIMSPCCLSPRSLAPANAEIDKMLEQVKRPEDSAKLPFFARAQLAAAAAWSPNPKKPPLFLDLPTQAGEAQPEILAKWAANAPLAFIHQYIGNIRRYRAIALDVGDQDGLRIDTAKLHEVLDAYGIANTFEIYAGDHTNKLGDRFQNHVLPFFSGSLCFEAGCRADETSLRARADEKAKALVAQLTLDEKVEQLLNTAPAIPRLNIPAYNWWTESLHGASGPVPTTNFPEPIGLAAAFDEALVHDVAAAISVEVRALHALGRKTGRLGRIGTGLNTWSPNINIFRDPRWGRGQETYGEDPFLTARLGVAYVRGMQGPDPDRPDVIASPKHFAVHSGPESTRHVANVFVSPHDLEDTYLPAFRAAVVEGQAGSIMCAYNRIDGEPACVSNLLLRERLHDAWKFQGYVVSDCDAVKDISDQHKFAPDAVAAAAAALKAGVDNECTTATLFDIGGLGERYKKAYERGLINMDDIDQALIRLFSARYRNGDLPGVADRSPLDGSPAHVTTPEGDALALKSAEKSLVLLKNDGVLPLNGTERIAVVGPHADATRVLRGNYSSQLSSPPISLVAGLRSALPKARVTLVPWSPSITDGDPIPTTALRAPSGEPGLLAEYYDADEALPERYATQAEYAARASKVKFKSKPSIARVEPGIAMRGNEFARLSDYYRVVWTGFLAPPESGTYRIGLSGPNAELVLGGKVLAAHRDQPWGTRSEMMTLELEKGRRYPIRVTADALLLAGVEVLWKRVSTKPGADLRAAAAQSDVIIAAVGLNSDLEGEEMKVEIEGFSGGDKTSLDLPADQRELLEQVKATGKPLIVVLMNGSPLDLSWAKEHASAIIEAWYPGQAGGLALANVIIGRTNPAGRLPLTFYRSVADLPPFEDYSMKGRTYRYFDGTPVYPFGYGLSYSTFEYGPVSVEQVEGSGDRALRVTTTIRNTSQREGEEVAQLYLDPPEFEDAPRLALRGFQRVQLQAGEQRTITFDLSLRDLSFVTRSGVRQTFPGEHLVTVGSGQPRSGVPVQSATFKLQWQKELAH